MAFVIKNKQQFSDRPTDRQTLWFIWKLHFQKDTNCVMYVQMIGWTRGINKQKNIEN